MWVVLIHTKNGLPACCWRLMKSTARLTTSSSIVSIRLRFSGPVSVHVRRPTLPSAVLGPVILLRGFAVQHAARTELGAEGRILRIVDVLRFFLGIEAIQVAVELIEAVHGRQELVAIPEVILPNRPVA